MSFLPAIFLLPYDKKNWIDEPTFIFLKKMAENVAFDIYYQDQNAYMLHNKDGSYTSISGSGQTKIASVILESMSPAIGWKKR